MGAGEGRRRRGRPAHVRWRPPTQTGGGCGRAAAAAAAAEGGGGSRHRHSPPPAVYPACGSLVGPQHGSAVAAAAARRAGGGIWTRSLGRVSDARRPGVTVRRRHGQCPLPPPPPRAASVPPSRPAASVPPSRPAASVPPSGAAAGTQSPPPRPPSLSTPPLLPPPRSRHGTAAATTAAPPYQPLLTLASRRPKTAPHAHRRRPHVDLCPQGQSGATRNGGENGSCSPRAPRWAREPAPPFPPP